MSRIFALVLIFLISGEAQARLLVNVSMVYRNGIDKNLVLESELHSVEEVWGKRRISLTMKNGTRLEMRAGFWERPIAKLDSIGPSSTIFFEGKLFQPNGKLAKEVDRRNSQIEMGENFVMNYRDQTQLIEVSIKPYME